MWWLIHALYMTTVWPNDRWNYGLCVWIHFIALSQFDLLSLPPISVLPQSISIWKKAIVPKSHGVLWHGQVFSITDPLSLRWARWLLKSPASRLCARPLRQAQFKENIKAPRHWPLWWPVTSGFPSQKASNAENVSIWWRHHVRKSTGHWWIILAKDQ